ncbi:MAG: ACT domain-containing protein [Syntrophomonadaceae bacterium]|jgi:ACT domain-containing protein|nr:ACT domain-containing protein [Syntrophomonadaceae bacterium]
MEEGTRIIITVVGYDRVGIIAGIANILADAGANILDINQTILQGFFTMSMVVDVGKMSVELTDLTRNLKNKGRELGLEINVQHEDIFRFMHRI